MQIVAIVTGVRPGSPGWDAPWVVHPKMGDAFDTSRVEALQQLYYELAVLGRFHSIAVLMRGRHDAWTSDMPRFRDVAATFPLPAGISRPTFELFLDTGSWHHAAANGTFDCGNEAHWRRAWADIIDPWFAIFKGSQLARLPNGDVPVTVWSIATGVGFKNQAHAGRMLQFVSGQIQRQYGVSVSFIVDESFVEFASSGHYYGVHDWFDPRRSGHTVRAYRGMDGLVTVGVVVPGFHDPPHVPPAERRILSRRDGETLRDGLAACAAAGCDRVYFEGFTGWEEQTLGMVTDAWGTRELDTVRSFVETTMDPILDANLNDFDTAYRLAVPDQKAALARIRAHYAETRGNPPDDQAIGHILIRALREWLPGGAGLRWPTLRRAMDSNDPGDTAPAQDVTSRALIAALEEGGFFGWNGQMRYAPPGDFTALSKVFDVPPDHGDMTRYSNDRDWRWQIQRMRDRAS